MPSFRAARNPTTVATQHYLGPLGYGLCQNCLAFHWEAERTSPRSETPPRYGRCCKNGHTILPNIFRVPEGMQNLYQGSGELSDRFRRNIRAYNNAFAFLSTGGHRDMSVAGQMGIYTFKIQGQLYHRLGSLTPATGTQPQFAQIYFFSTDPEQAASVRSSGPYQNLEITTVRALQHIIETINPYASFLRSQKHILDHLASTGQDVGVRFAMPGPLDGPDPRTYSLPRAEEVAALIFDGAGTEAAGRDLIVQYQNGPLQYVSEAHPAFLALRFPILNPYGHHGWSWYIPRKENPRTLFSPNADEAAAVLRDPTVVRGPGRGGSLKVSLEMFHCFHLFQRPQFSALLHAGALMQEYVVDAWAMCEQERLRFCRHNQGTLRADLFTGLFDALMNNTDLNNIGVRVILPSSFTQGPRYMQSKYHDAMALVRVFGKPDLFITITCNPSWREIQENLKPFQTASDRPDLVCRVFSLKLKELMDLLTQKEIFGKVKAFVWSVEFQKRGLPHAHILLTLASADKLRSAAAIDSVVSAELPCPVAEPELHRQVMSHMLHGPCTASSPCMQDEKNPNHCSRRFPFAFREETSAGEDGYPMYRRRAEGPSVIQRTGRGERKVDSSWVVPHNPYLLQTFNCHVNVEVCTSIRAVKYLFKYIFKGPDRASVALGPEVPQRRDEISEYVDARYISACEGTYRLLELPLHGINPSVMQLDIHLENQHRVRFDPNDREGTAILIRDGNGTTKLLEFFKLCALQPEATANLTYPDVPRYYKWSSSRWVRRARQGTGQVGRVYFVPQSAGPKFYMRMLLHHVQGPKSFADLRSFQGTQYATFRDACEARGLLTDDAEWDYCLTDAAHLQPGAAMRRLFCSIILLQRVDSPAALYDRHKDALADDCRYRLQRRGIPSPSYERCLSFSRALLRDTFISMKPEFDLAESGVPPPDDAYAHDLENIPVAVLEELGYNVFAQRTKAEMMISQMTPEQKSVFDSIRTAIDSPDPSHPAMFFLDGPGGCGKTFVENALLAYTRGEEKIALAVAASGIAALMLEGGRTAHSRFKIPLGATPNTTCSIPVNSTLAELMKRASAIVWDEAPMQNAYGVEAVDRLLRDIRKCATPFGGMVVLFSGDWRQTLPIVRGGTTAETMRACLHHSPLWKDMVPLQLHTNLRLLRTVDSLPPDAAASQLLYNDWTMAIGDGRAPVDDEGRTLIPDSLRLNGDSPDPLIQHVYENIPPSPLTAEARAYWQKRAILHALNIDVETTNESILNLLPGRMQSFSSADTAYTNDGDPSPAFSAEYLATITPSGSPPHILNLKVGAPVMLLRNFDIPNGLCNGTRLIVTAMRRNVLQLSIISGAENRIGQTVLLPRIDVQTGEGVLPFLLSRRQFPIKLCFAMTINKSQGQSLQRVGIDLRSHCFSHGQLYVAVSRATDASTVKILLPTEHTKSRNVVLRSALPHLTPPTMT